MTYRGRLIFRFQAELFQLDTQATDADPDGAGPLESGYDIDFRETVNVPVAGKQVGDDARAEKTAIRLLCQIEPITNESLQQLFAGNVPNAQVILIFHFSELEKRGFVDTTTGNALIQVGDRLAALYNSKGVVVQSFDKVPVFVTERRPVGFGLSSFNPQRNLLAVAFNDRDRGVRA